MIHLFKTLQIRNLLISQLPAIALSMVFVEAFVKLGSFTLECLVFFCLWAVIEKLTHLFQSKS